MGESCTTDAPRAPSSAPTAAATRRRAHPRGRRVPGPHGEVAAVVRLCTFAIARAPRPLPGSACAPCSLARLIAQSLLCSPCVPRTARVHAPPPRRCVQLIGGGGAGAPSGEPRGCQGDGQCTPPPALFAARMRPLPHPPLALLLNHPLLAACATYRTGRRHSTTPLRSHRRRWCWRCSRRTRRPPRRRTRYDAPSPVCSAIMRPLPHPPLASSLSHPLLAVCATYRTGGRHSTAPLITAHRWRLCRGSTRCIRRPSRRRTRYAAPGPVCRDHGASHPPAARLVAQPPPCSPCVPRTGREDATPPRRSVQHIGGGGAGAACGVPGGRQGDGQGTPPRALCAARMRPLTHPPPASSLSRPSARRVCHVQNGHTPAAAAAKAAADKAAADKAGKHGRISGLTRSDCLHLNGKLAYVKNWTPNEDAWAIVVVDTKERVKVGKDHIDFDYYKPYYTPLHYAAASSSSVAEVQALLAAYPEAAKATPLPGSACAPCSLARLIAQSLLCSPCVPRTARVHAPPPRRCVQLIGGGGAGAPSGEPRGCQGDGQCTPPPALFAARMRPLPHPPLALLLNHPLLAACATYRTGRRHSTTPLRSHRRRWCWRCSRRTRRPPRRRTRYAAPGPVCRAHATSPPPPLASSLSHPLLAVSAPYSWGTGRRPSTSPLRSAHRWRWFRRSSWRTRRPSWRRTRYAAPGPVCRDHGASPPPAARLVAQPPPCSPCVPRIGREHAPPPRRSVQLIGGGCSGAARGVP